MKATCALVLAFVIALSVVSAADAAQGKRPTRLWYQVTLTLSAHPVVSEIDTDPPFPWWKDPSRVTTTTYDWTLMSVGPVLLRVDRETGLVGFRRGDFVGQATIAAVTETDLTGYLPPCRATQAVIWSGYAAGGLTFDPGEGGIMRSTVTGANGSIVQHPLTCTRHRHTRFEPEFVTEQVLQGKLETNGEGIEVGPVGGLPGPLRAAKQFGKRRIRAVTRVPATTSEYQIGDLVKSTTGGGTFTLTALRCPTSRPKPC